MKKLTKSASVTVLNADETITTGLTYCSGDNRVSDPPPPPIAVSGNCVNCGAPLKKWECKKVLQ